MLCLLGFFNSDCILCIVGKKISIFILFIYILMELNLICIEECRNLIFYLIYCNEYY